MTLHAKGLPKRTETALLSPLEFLPTRFFSPLTLAGVTGPFFGSGSGGMWGTLLFPKGQRGLFRIKSHSWCNNPLPHQIRDRAALMLSIALHGALLSPIHSHTEYYLFGHNVRTTYSRAHVKRNEGTGLRLRLQNQTAFDERRNRGVLMDLYVSREI